MKDFLVFFPCSQIEDSHDFAYLLALVFMVLGHTLISQWEREKSVFSRTSVFSTLLSLQFSETGGLFKQTDIHPKR